MTSAARKLKVRCAYDGCQGEVKIAGLCQTHYHWEYYHRVRGHGMRYFKDRKAELTELTGRCEQQIGKGTARRGGLRAVK